MKLTTILQHLASQRLGTIGKDLFQIEMPASCDQGVLLLNNYYGTALNHELPGYIDTEIRVIVRAKDYEAGYAHAKKVQKALTIKQPITIGRELYIQLALPVAEPRPYRRSAGGYWEWEMELGIKGVDLLA